VLVDTELTGFLGLYLRTNKILSLNNLQENDTQVSKACQ
jgi:hypothetical protein